MPYLPLVVVLPFFRTVAVDTWDRSRGSIQLRRRYHRCKLKILRTAIASKVTSITNLLHVGLLHPFENSKLIGQRPKFTVSLKRPSELLVYNYV